MIWLVASVLAVAWFWSSSMKLSENFSLSEFTRSATADREGIDNTPSAEQVANLRALAVSVLQPLRDAIGKPIRITSGYRSPALNAAVNGSDKSQHVKGEAADFVVDSMSSANVANLVQELGLPYDQLIVYAPSRGGHVHVSYKRSGRPNRRERLYAPASGGYEDA